MKIPNLKTQIIKPKFQISNSVKGLDFDFGDLFGSWCLVLVICCLVFFFGSCDLFQNNVCTPCAILFSCCNSHFLRGNPAA